MGSEPIQLCLFDFDDSGNEPPNHKSESEIIESLLLHGSGFVNGKQRIYNFGLTKPSISAFAKMLKSEYGIGGRSAIGAYIRWVWFESSGIRFKWRSGEDEWTDAEITWNKAADVISRLIKQGKYLGNRVEEESSALIRQIVEQNPTMSTADVWNLRTYSINDLRRMV
ncbi:hypothetical protein D3C72_247290 [compost metagenome]